LDADDKPDIDSGRAMGVVPPTTVGSVTILCNDKEGTNVDELDTGSEVITVKSKATLATTLLVLFKTQTTTMFTANYFV
jgi:hypothetical protein